MPVLENLLPVNYTGKDGYVWFIGIIEKSSLDDQNSKPGYRYKVRIIGDHPSDKDILPTDDLPWATVMMPVTTPFTAGNLGGATPSLDVGGWVVGFYLDVDMQKPLIIGSIGQLPTSTTVVNYQRNDDLSFLTSIPQHKVDPYVDGEPPQENTVGGPNHPYNNSIGGLQTFSVGDYTQKEKDNMIPPIDRVENVLKSTGIYSEEWCQETANRCGPKNIKETFTGIFEELFTAIGERAGEVASDSGLNIIGNISGSIKNIKNIVRKYINKTAYVIDHFVAKLKGTVKDALNRAVEAIIKAIIRPTPEGNILTPITKFFNKLLVQVDCIMEDLGERLQEWLSNVLFGYVDEIYKATACQVDRFTQGVLEQIYGLADLLLFKILEPIENILLIMQNPLNLLRIVDEKLLKILGITCSSPTLKCDIFSSICTNGTRGEDGEDILDQIIDSINNAFPGERDDVKYICDDAKGGNVRPSTRVQIIGGVEYPINVNVMVFSVPENLEFNQGDVARITVKRLGFTDVAASVRYSIQSTSSSTPDVDYASSEGVIAFADGETEKNIEFQIYYTPAIIEPKVLFVSIRIETPINAEDLLLRYQDGRRITKVTIRHPFDRVGGSSGGLAANTVLIQQENINPITDVNNAISGEQPDPEPEEEIIEPSPDFNEDNLPEDEGQVEDPEEPGEMLDLSTEDDEELDEELEEQEKEIEQEETEQEDEREDPVVTPPELNPNTRNFDESTSITISTDRNVYNAGDAILYKITTENIESGTEFEYTLLTQDLDIIDGPTKSTFIIEGTSIMIPVLLREVDYLLEESLDFIINDVGVSHSVLVVNDESQEQEAIIEETERKQLPIISENIITDVDGGIIDIPIQTSGNVRYAEPPYVAISGAGYGARGIAVLNDTGVIEEIRVLDSGIGYVVNTDEQLRCVIDDFTVVRPGYGYNNIPEMYVNGDSSVAEAIINDDGFVVGARLLKRDLIYDKMPIIDLIGGGGFGARLLASIACVTVDQYENRLQTGVRVRKGTYIDCP